MPDDSPPSDNDQRLDEMARQACLLAEHFRRGEVDHAGWLLREIAAELRHIQKPT